MLVCLAIAARATPWFDQHWSAQVGLDLEQKLIQNKTVSMFQQHVISRLTSRKGVRASLCFKPKFTRPQLEAAFHAAEIVPGNLHLWLCKVC